jgi:hypothetical protein
MKKFVKWTIVAAIVADCVLGLISAFSLLDFLY